MIQIKDPTIYLTHIFHSIASIEKHLQGVTEEQFNLSEEKQALVIRMLEIIGEATKNIPDEMRKQHPDIPWKDMAGMRDVLIHQYFDINLNTVWKTATQFVPPLKNNIQHLLQKYAS